MEQNSSFSEKKRKQKNHSKTSKDIRVSDNNSDHIMTAADDSGPPKSIIDNAKKVINSLRMIEVKKEQQGRPQTDTYD